jgi:hypothetical protein
MQAGFAMRPTAERKADARKKDSLEAVLVTAPAMVLMVFASRDA